MGEQGVVRMNVSVPRGLKERMDAAAESVNWSAVAARAFEGRLLELQSQKKGMKMEEVIARLTAAAELENNEFYQAGRQAGEAWARGKATPRQLRRLEELLQNEEYHGEASWVLETYTNGLNHGISVGLAEDLNPRQDIETSEFWEAVLGDDAERIEDLDFARGFVEGALDIWQSVKDKL